MSSPAKDLLRVLIVEDDALYREFLRAGLERRFPTVEFLEAGSSAEASRVAEESRPEACLIDIGLPDGSGLELAARLREGLPEVVLGICTMNDLPQYREAAHRRGVDFFFGKERLEWRALEGFVRAARGRSEPAGAVARDLGQAVSEDCGVAEPAGPEDPPEHRTRPPPTPGC